MYTQHVHTWHVYEHCTCIACRNEFHYSRHTETSGSFFQDVLKLCDRYGTLKERDF